MPQRTPAKHAKNGPGMRVNGSQAGSTAPVWRIWTIVGLYGVGLPVAAWWFMQRMASAKPPYSRRRMDAFGAPVDAVDAWLIDQYHLPAVRRWSVRRAVFGGKEVPEESLRPVARELASEILAGRVASGYEYRSGWALAGAAGSAVIFALAVFVITGHVRPWLVSPAIVGLLTVVAGLAGPKLVHHRLERAKRLNT